MPKSVIFTRSGEDKSMRDTNSNIVLKGDKLSDF